MLWVDIEDNHTMTSGINGVPDGYWNSGLMSPADSFTFVFDSVDTFLYLYATLATRDGWSDYCKSSRGRRG